MDLHQDLLYAQMIVQYGLTPEQVDGLPIRTLVLLPVVRDALREGGGGENAQ